MRRATLGAIAALLLGACGQTTQVVVTVDTDRCDIESFRVMADGEAVDFPLAQDDRPISVAISGSDSFDLVIEGLSEGRVIARTEGRVAFSPGEILTLPVEVGPTCSPEEPCALGDTSAFEEEPEPLVRDCGERVRRYVLAETAFDQFIDGCSIAAPVSNAEPLLVDASGEEAQLVFPDGVLEEFDFRFYGQRVSSIWVSDDGVMSFSVDAPRAAGAISAIPLDQSAAPRPSIMAFWDNLRTRADGVCWAITGAAPNRTLLATWSNVCTSNCATGDDMNFTIGLEEGTDRVVLTYGTMASANPERARGQFATVGIVSSTPSACPAGQCDAEGVCSDGSACGFTQAFAQTVQAAGLTNLQLTPVVE